MHINSTALSISDALTEKEYYTTVTVTVDHYCCTTLTKFKISSDIALSLDNLLPTAAMKLSTSSACAVLCTALRLASCKYINF